MDTPEPGGVGELAIVMLVCLATGGVAAAVLSSVAGTVGLAAGLFGGSVAAFFVLRLFVLR